MNISMQKALDSSELITSSYTVGFCGLQLDDRGRGAVGFLGEKCPQQIELKYHHELYKVQVGSSFVDVDDFHVAFAPLVTGRVLLESTTLGFVEILLCCRSLAQLGVDSYDLLYVEPEDYRKPTRRHILHRRDFTISKGVPGYQGIPGFAQYFTDRRSHKGVFFVGYEEARLRRAFEDLEMIQAEETAIAFGIPAFKPGWEMDSLANNINVIKDKNLRGGLHFCGAENPAAALDVLLEAYQSLDPNQRLFVAPIGTKPHGIGVALFASLHRDVGIIYDHPNKNDERTRRIANWHLFSVQNASTSP